jgi:hypothetical protein
VYLNRQCFNALGESLDDFRQLRVLFYQVERPLDEGNFYYLVQKATPYAARVCQVLYATPRALSSIGAAGLGIAGSPSVRKSYERAR